MRRSLRWTRRRRAISSSSTSSTSTCCSATGGPAGYAAALERFDARLPEITGRLRAGDLLVLTADHGCDPTYAGTDHTRERVPVLMTGAGVRPGPAGVRASFADIAETIAAWLGLPRGAHGTPIDLSG